MDTFRENPRFNRTCFRASTRIHLSQTQPRATLDVRRQYAVPVKSYRENIRGR